MGELMISRFVGSKTANKLCSSGDDNFKGCPIKIFAYSENFQCRATFNCSCFDSIYINRSSCF